MTLQPLGVYIHWPFCKSKCPYCDFNSHVRDGVEQARWRRALLTELEHAAREAPGRMVQTMFFGGGTPSLMAPETVAALIARTRALWDTANDLEITLEANPTSVEAGNFAALAAAGINRVSLGLQALDPAALRFLGREHSVEEALAALATARRHFRRFSFDLIYARPEDIRRLEWRRRPRPCPRARRPRPPRSASGARRRWPTPASSRPNRPGLSEGCWNYRHGTLNRTPAAFIKARLRGRKRWLTF
jgi:organic radical activating enzyme